MKKPICPKKPEFPVEPDKHVVFPQHITTLDFFDKKYVLLSDLIEKHLKNKDLSKIRIEPKYGNYYDEGDDSEYILEVNIIEAVEANDADYDRKMKLYQKQLSVFNGRMEQYNVKYKRYLEDEKAYQVWLKEQKKKDDVIKLEQLMKEAEKLKKTIDKYNRV